LAFLSPIGGYSKKGKKMKHKSLLIAAFALVAMAQLLVPTLMISYKADYALKGKEFIFKIRHNRIGSSLRGNYLWLQFEADKFKVEDKSDWENSQRVFVTFGKDSVGYAKILNLTKEEPQNSQDWIKVRAFTSRLDSSSLRITYPFGNYYIPDGDKKEVQSLFNQVISDSLKTISLKVHVKENQFLAGELMLDSVSFSDVLKGFRQ
jgi:uncharacterized membrane-anchored protein